MTGRYRLFGLTVESGVALAAPASSDDPDLRLTAQPQRPIPADPPDGPLIAGGVEPLISWIVRLPDGTILGRIPGFAEYSVAADLREVAVTIDPAYDPGVVAVLASGTIPAVVLGLRGTASLHASAVATPAGAIVLAGHSGSGKSTLAALLCGAGAALLTDDLVRMDDDGCVVPGATQIRLRPAAESLADSVSAAEPAERTADERLAVAPAAADGPVPVAAVVLALPRRDIENVEIAPLEPADAAVALMEFSRVRGWREPRAMKALFELCSLLARRPVYRADVPWGPPFAPATVQALLSLAEESKPRR